MSEKQILSPAEADSIFRMPLAWAVSSRLSRISIARHLLGSIDLL